MNAATLTTLIIRYKYGILFPLACLEGPLLALLAGFLCSAGYLNPFLAYPTFIVGDIVPDIIYYYIGRVGRHEKLLGRYAFFQGKVMKHIEWLWHHYGQRTMVLTKLAYGFSVPLLITAGIAHIPPGKFLRYALPVAAAQYATFLLVGYYMGESYFILQKYIPYAEVIILVFLLVGIVTYTILARRARQYLMEMK